MKKEGFFEYIYKNAAEEWRRFENRRNVRLELRINEMWDTAFLCIHIGKKQVFFDLNHLYEQYLAGSSKLDLLHDVLDSWKEGEALLQGIDGQEMDCFDAVKDRLKIHLHAKDFASRRQGFYRECYREFTAFFYVGYEDPEQYGMDLPVLQSHFCKWGVTGEDVLQAALDNQQKDGVLLVPLHEAAGEIRHLERYNFFYEIPTGQDVQAVSGFLLTTGSREYGASLILNPKVLRRIREIIGRNFFILPSSVHETMIVPDQEWSSPEFSDMIREINKAEISGNERLCDHAFYYSAQKDFILSITEYSAIREAKAICH